VSTRPDVNEAVVIAFRDAAEFEAWLPQAAQAFNALTKTQRYVMILELVTARTATARAARLRKAMTALEARGA
jgi:uncharacterized protein YdeI (YjbR/CyaY-like superfamily)